MTIDFFLKKPATTEINTYEHTLSLNDALPISHPAAGPHITLERGAPGLGQQLHRPGIAAEGRVALEIDQRQVVRVHVLAGPDVAGGHADDGVVLAQDRKSTRLNSSH